MTSRAPLDRRDFLSVSGAAAAATLLGAGPTRAAEAKARVVLVRRREVLGADGRVNGPVLHAMLNEAVAALLGEKDAAAAWRRLVKPSDVVGVKSNVWGPLRTPPELEQAIRDEVVGAGVRPDNVDVDDRGVRTNPVFRRMTALVNVRPMRTHSWSGVGTCVKNVIMFADNPPDYHGDSCATLGALWHLPQLAGKGRLNVLVMLTPQFHSVGPHSFARDLVWPYYGLIVGVQPVPVDATGARILQAKRRQHFGADRPISPSPHHIEIAGSRYGLGPTDPAQIDLVRLGLAEDALI
jgi:TAT (twin-arginine translocation) pathway signal sequence